MMVVLKSDMMGGHKSWCWLTGLHFARGEADVVCSCFARQSNANG